MRVLINKITRSVAAPLAVLITMAAASPIATAGVKDTVPPLKHITINLGDKTALRNGAMFFMQRCMACHSIQGTRFTELTKPLGLPPQDIAKYLNPTSRRVTQTIISAMPHAVAVKFLNKAPPDLTVMEKSLGANFLYTYLTSFYVDPSRPTGVNNVVFNNVAMPDVFARLQGLQAPVLINGYKQGKPAKVAVGVKPLTQGTMTPKQFDTMAKDIVTFLYWVAHPHQQERHAMGPWILGLIALLTFLSYLLYKAYWARVVPPEGGRWPSYWKK